MKSLIKKSLSLFLSILMLATMLPGFALSASADGQEYFLFAYFTGNGSSEQQIRFAVSTDGLNFDALNANQAVIKATKTSANNSSGCARDPYIYQAQDGSYYLLATDMDATGIHSSWNGDTCMYVWHSEDLVNWQQINDWDVSAAGAFEGSGYGSVSINGNNYSLQNTIRMWAPQFIWDANEQAYMVYWANFFSDWNNAVLYSYTTDFINYSNPGVLFKTDSGSAIDSDIIYNSSDGLYYQYYKDESTADILYATASSLTGPYTYAGEVYTNEAYGNALEGANCHYINGTLTMFIDAYTSGNFVVMQSSNYQNFTKLDESAYSVNHLDPRHASVIQITKAEYDRLVDAFGMTTSSDVMYYFTKEYSNSASGWQYYTYSDSSKRNIDIMFEGSSSSATIAKGSGSATLSDATFFVNDEDVRAMIPDNVYTVSFDYTRTNSTVTGAPVFALGDNSPKDYVMLFDNGDIWVRPSSTDTDTYVSNTAIDLGIKYHFDIVSDGTNITFYKDGEQIAQTAATISFPTSGVRYAAFGFTDAHNTYGYGTYGKIRFRDTALSSDDIADEFSSVSAEEARAYVEANYANLGVIPSFNAQPYHRGDAIPQTIDVSGTYLKAYSNIVYSPIWSTSWSGNGVGDTATGVGRTNFKAAMPLNTVLVYDGVHDVISPVMIETVCNDTNGSSHIIHYVGVYSSNGFELRYDWNGYGTDWQQWASNNIAAVDNFSFRDNNNENESDDSQRDSSSRFWWNALYYNGSGDTTSYYSVDTNITFYAHTSYKQNNSRSHKYGNFTALSNNYVINYQPVYNIVAGSTKVPNTNQTAYNYYNNVVKGNEWMFTDASLDQYFIAMYKVLISDPNNSIYDYASNTASAVASCGANIKSAVAEFAKVNLVKKTFTVTYNLSNSTDTETVTAGNCLANIPANTAAANVSGTYTHTKYEWPANVNSSYMPRTDVEFTEIATTEACTDANGDGYCDVCNLKLKELANWSAFDSAKASLLSLLSGSQSTAAYDAEVLDQVADLIANDVPNFNSTNEERKGIFEEDQATVVDTQTAAINSAINLLNNDVVDSSTYAQAVESVNNLNVDAYDVDAIQNSLNNYSITRTVAIGGTNYIGFDYNGYYTEYCTKLNTDYIPYTIVVDFNGSLQGLMSDGSLVPAKINGYDDDGFPEYTKANGAALDTFRYGDSVTVSTDDGYPYAWSSYAFTNGSGYDTTPLYKFMTTGESVTFNVRGNTVLKVGEYNDSATCRVDFRLMLNGAKTGTVLETRYLIKGETVDLSADPVEANIAFFNMAASPYIIEGVNIGTEFTPDEDCIVYVNFTGSKAEYAGTIYDFNGDALGAWSGAYNELITLSYDSAIAFVDDSTISNTAPTVLCYGSTYSFYACDNTNITVIYAEDDFIDDEFASVWAISQPIVREKNSGKQVYMVGSFALPQGCTAKSFGFILDPNCSYVEGELNLSIVDKHNDLYNLSAGRALNTAQRGNQFAINFYNNGVFSDANYVAYVVYEQNGVEKYAYSPVVADASIF